MSTEIGNILNQQAEMDQDNEPTQNFGNPMSSNQDVMQSRGGQGRGRGGRGGQGRGRGMAAQGGYGYGQGGQRGGRGRGGMGQQQRQMQMEAYQNINKTLTQPQQQQQTSNPYMQQQQRGRGGRGGGLNQAPQENSGLVDPRGRGGAGRGGRGGRGGQDGPKPWGDSDTIYKDAAKEIDRDLFKNGQKWDFKEYRKHMLAKCSVTDKLGMAYFDNEKVDENFQDRVVMASYPRSGNTMLRAYMEKIMGVVTGSDADITKKLINDLMEMGLGGEGIYDNQVWVIKTHYPERFGKGKFYAERVLLLLRNPVDCITSLFHMMCAGSHNKSLSDKNFEDNMDVWAEFVQQEITIWRDFHEFYLNSKVPVHIIRYEDILQQPKQTMTDLFRFMLNSNKLEGTNVEKFIDLTVAEEAPQIYKPRSGKVNANLKKFTPEMIQFMWTHASDTLTKLGYASTYTDIPQGDDARKFITEFNEKNLRKSMFTLHESKEITGIYMNYGPLLIRKKSLLYPDGRSSEYVKGKMKTRLEIEDRNAKAKDKTEDDKKDSKNDNIVSDLGAETDEK